MIQKEELIKLIRDNGLNAFEASQMPKINDNTMILKEVNDIINFCQVNDIKNIFYHYILLDKEDYIIDDELQEEIEKEIYKLIKKEIKAHNKRIESIDFTRPVVVNIATIFDGNVICVLQSDEWDEEINLLNAEDTIEYLQENYEDILEQKEIERQEKLEELKSELKEYILNDETFFICSNQKLRRNYANTLSKNRNVKKYLEPFKNEYTGRVIISALDTFVEVVWAEYKKMKNN